MVNLGNLELKLNSDPRLRADFMKDPVGMLQREGILLSFEQQTELRKAVKALVNQKASISGSSIEDAKMYKLMCGLL